LWGNPPKEILLLAGFILGFKLYILPKALTEVRPLSVLQRFNLCQIDLLGKNLYN